MLEKLILKNILSHKDSTLNLCDGLNLITGETDSGKSAIVKGLEWLIFNEYSVDEIMNWGNGVTSCSMGAKFVNGPLVERIKTSSFNGWKIDGDPLKLSTNREVPEEVARLFNMSSLNLHKQLDLPFLLLSSSGEISRYLNKVVSLEKIDISLYNLQSDLRENKANTLSQKKELDRLKALFEGYRYLPDCKSKFSTIKGNWDALTKEMERRDELDGLIANMMNIQEDIDSKSKRIDGAPELLSSIKEKANRLESLKTESRELTKLLGDIERGAEAIETLSRTIQKQKKGLESIIPEFCPFCNQPIKKGKLC